MISKELIKKLKRIEIHMARLANDQLAGSYHSVFKGRGMAFSEVRQYQPGDDVRFIDWNVSARMGETYVKVFTEEREVTVMLMVDLSGSQRFGTGAQSKLDLAAEVSALLAFSAIKNNDRVGLILFTDRVERFVPPRKGRAHVMRVVSEILRAEPEHRGTRVQSALEHLGRVTKRSSIAFLVSDFQDQGFERSMRVTAKRHDLIPVQLVDEREEALPSAGLATLEDPETGRVHEVDLGSREVRRWFQQAAVTERLRREQLFKHLQVDHVTLRTGEDYVRPFSQLFQMRSKRLRGFR